MVRYDVLVFGVCKMILSNSSIAKLLREQQEYQNMNKYQKEAKATEDLKTGINKLLGL